MLGIFFIGALMLVIVVVIELHRDGVRGAADFEKRNSHDIGEI
jgi:hypothetical protein